MCSMHAIKKLVELAAGVLATHGAQPLSAATKNFTYFALDGLFMCLRL